MAKRLCCLQAVAHRAEQSRSAGQWHAFLAQIRTQTGTDDGAGCMVTEGGLLVIHRHLPSFPKRFLKKFQTCHFIGEKRNRFFFFSFIPELQRHLLVR